jgi:hypothetical protein
LESEVVQLECILELCSVRVNGDRIDVTEMGAAFVDVVGGVLPFEDGEQAEPVAVARVEANAVW